MRQSPDPFVNSEKNFASHEYLNRDRSLPLIREQLTYATAGHLLETYVDALHVTLLMDEPSFLIRVKESPELIRNPTFIRATHHLPPKYVIEAIGNYLESPSFFVKHLIGKPNEPARQDKQQAAATQFAQDVHGQLRQLGIRFEEKLELNFFPPRGRGHELDSSQRTQLKRNDPKGAISEFKHGIEQYKKLFEQFTKEYRLAQFKPEGDATAPLAPMTPLQKKEVFDAFERSSQLTSFNQTFAPVIEKLRIALSPPALEYLFIGHQDTFCRLENTPLNPKFPASTPALILTALGFVGRHQIDRTFFPKIGFNFLMTAIGVESNVSDNTERLNRRIAAAFQAEANPLADDILFPEPARNAFSGSVEQHSRGIQFLRLFHKTAGLLETIYPPDKAQAAFEDMEQLLTLVGENMHLKHLETPEEAASLLYAIERRLRAQLSLEKDFYNSIGALLNKAGHLGRKKDLSEIPPRLRSDILYSLQAIEDREQLEAPVLRAMLPAMALLRRTLGTVH